MVQSFRTGTIGHLQVARRTRGGATLTLLVSVLSAPGLLASCGGGQSVKSAEDAEPHRDDDPSRRLSTQAEIGALNEELVTAGFREALPTLQDCLNKGSQRNEFLGGDIMFYIRINQSRQIEHVHAEHSTLGDRETEKCMFEALGHASWPAPEGGLVGIARSSFQFDMPNDVRAPVDWSEGDVEPQKAALASEIANCKAGSSGQSSGSGKFSATIYVDTEGTALGASVTPPDEMGESAVDCLIGVLLGARYASPGSWPAKVTFTL